jgi:hypothetical protein
MIVGFLPLSCFAVCAGGAWLRRIPLLVRPTALSFALVASKQRRV